MSGFAPALPFALSLSKGCLRDDNWALTGSARTVLFEERLL